MSEEQISASLFKEMTAETVHYLQDKYGDKIQDYPHVMNMVAKWEKNIMMSKMYAELLRPKISI